MILSIAKLRRSVDRVVRLRALLRNAEVEQNHLEWRYRASVLEAYRQADGKKKKTALLDQFCAVFNYHRKSAVMWIRWKLLGEPKCRASRGSGKKQFRHASHVRVGLEGKVS